MVTIDDRHEGQRIDNYLLRELKGVPKSIIYRILRKGEVRVNKGRIQPAYRLCSGDQVRIPPLRLAADRDEASPPDALQQQLADAILYEDDNLLILNKPSGLAVHAGSGLKYGVIEVLRALRPDAHFLELVHRLDRETSGCLVLAKNRASLTALHGMLRQSRQVEKRYLALLCGAWEGGKRTLEAPLRKNVLRGGERMVEVDAAGKQAVSHFLPLSRYAHHTLVEVLLETGRTHQIRVHAAHMQHPVAGDSKYGERECNLHMRSLGLRRLFLHAHVLAFTLPETGREIHVSAPLPPELQHVLDELEQIS